MGHPDRVRGRINGKEEDWDYEQEPRTLSIGERQGRWVLKKRKLSRARCTKRLIALRPLFRSSLAREYSAWAMLTQRILV